MTPSDSAITAEDFSLRMSSLFSRPDALRRLRDGDSLARDLFSALLAITAERDRLADLVRELTDDDGDQWERLCMTYPKTTRDFIERLHAAEARAAELVAAQDRESDRRYLLGLRAGWNMGVAGDNKAFDRASAALPPLRPEDKA